MAQTQTPTIDLEKNAMVNETPLQDSQHTLGDASLKTTIQGRRKNSSGLIPEKEIGYDGEMNTVNSLGRLYTTVMHFNVVTRNLVYILPACILLAIPLVLFATVAKNTRAGGIRLLGLFVWLEIVWLSLWVSKLVAQTFPAIFTFLCGFVSSGTRKYRLVIKALEIPISLLFWSIISWATVPVITTFDDHRQAGWVSTLARVILASIAVAAMFLLKKLTVQLIGINYHRRQFNARVKESKQKVRMLDTLYNASVSLFPAYCPEFLEEDYEILTGFNSQSGQRSAANPNLIGGLAWVGENVQSVVGNVASEITGSRSFKATAAHSIVIEALEMKTSSEALGRRLWFSLVEEGKDALYPKDVVAILGEGSKSEAEIIFNSIDVDQNGDVSLEEMVLTVLNISHERKAIARSIHDVNQAVRVLDRFLSVVVFFLLAVIYAAFFSTGFSHYITTIGTQLAAVSFAISETVQEFLGSCIFLFVKHPYDVGDRVVIEGMNLIVDHISLLYTTFRRVDSNRVVQISNIKNNEYCIENISRSKAMKEQVSISVHADTSAMDIELLKYELQEFIKSPENKRDFFPEVEIEMVSVKDLKQLDLVIGVTHKSNWANEILRSSRRNKLLAAVVTALRMVPIYAPGSEKPLSILNTAKDNIETGRLRVQADRDAVLDYRRSADGLSTGVEFGQLSSAGNNTKQTATKVQDRLSIRSRGSGNESRFRRLVGLRRSGR